MDIRKIILEEVEDFDWIRNVDPRYTDIKVGDVIEITNIGDKRYFIHWLGMYSVEYLDGKYGDNINGIVSSVTKDTFTLIEKNTRDDINFPLVDYDGQSLKDWVDDVDDVDDEGNSLNQLRLKYELKHPNT